MSTLLDYPLALRIRDGLFTLPLFPVLYEIVEQWALDHGVHASFPITKVVYDCISQLTFIKRRMYKDLSRKIQYSREYQVTLVFQWFRSFERKLYQSLHPLDGCSSIKHDKGLTLFAVNTVFEQLLKDPTVLIQSK